MLVSLEIATPLLRIYLTANSRNKNHKRNSVKYAKELMFRAMERSIRKMHFALKQDHILIFKKVYLNTKVFKDANDEEISIM